MARRACGPWIVFSCQVELHQSAPRVVEPSSGGVGEASGGSLTRQTNESSDQPPERTQIVVTFGTNPSAISWNRAAGRGGSQELRGGTLTLQDRDDRGVRPPVARIRVKGQQSSNLGSVRHHAGQRFIRFGDLCRPRLHSLGDQPTLESVEVVIVHMDGAADGSAARIGDT